MTYAKSYVVMQKQKANELGWKKKAAAGLAVVALLFSFRPVGAIADVENPNPSGTVQITKYDCPADMDFDNSLTSPAKPDGNGDAVVPEGCVPAAGHKFGYIHEADRTDNSAPYAGRDDATPFSIAPGTTDSNGVIILTDLLNGGRNDLVELDDSNSVVSDDGLFGFMCNEDTGSKDDNYDIIFNDTGKTSYCNVYNRVEQPKDAVTINADKVVCLTEGDLPNWGDAGTQAGEPAVITASTAADYVDNSNGRCHLESDWSFQWGFAEKENTSGVNKLPGDLIGQADGTSTLGACNPTYCGNNTFTGAGYHDWKNFDTATSSNGTISATVAIDDLKGAPGIWVRENLKSGYVPFSYPPAVVPGSSVSAEIYCNDDIQNYDNYDEVTNPTLGNSYNCVAFNAYKGAIIEAGKVVCLTEADLPNWGDDGQQTGEPAKITATTASDYVAASNGQCHLEPDWTFQWGYAEKENTSGVNKLPGDLIGEADGTSTLGACNPTYCGNNTNTGTGYHDWKTFDSATSSGGAVSAAAVITDLQGAPGVWVRENLQEGYVPFSYPPQSAPGSNVSAEMYCNDDIQNYDNYDEIINPVLGQTYYCVAFNAMLDHGDDNDPCVSDVVVDKVQGEVKKFWFKGHKDDDNYVCKHVSGWKWQDMNGDGTWDPIDDNHGLAGWEFQAVDPVTHEVLATDFTDEDGYYEFNLPGDIQEIEIQEVTKPGWEITYPEEAFYLLDMSKGWEFIDNDFGNHLLNDDNGGNNGGSDKGSITGMVFEDTNDNGVFDEGDISELGGWKVYLDTNNNGSFDDGEQSVTTASPYTFSNLDDGDYHVRLVLQDGWVLTAPVGGVYDVTIVGANDATNKDFGVFDNGKGGTNSGSTSSKGSGSGSTSFTTPQVAGATTDNPQPQPEVLGATTLPRTGTPVWVFLVPLLALASLFVFRKKLA